jgi:inhibitor of KinA sporulation pathway (predicted exonuclease)
MRSNIANVLDLELTCYDAGIFPAGERPEIIEFGITTVDLTTRQILKTFSIPVVPTMSKVSPFCTALTGWTEAKLRRQGVSFEEACRRISEKYGGANRLLVTDSDDEADTVARQCQLLGVANPFGNSRQNVSTLFQLLMRDKRNVGLDEMLTALGLAFEGRRHSGADDSKNIARLFLAILDKASLNF